MDLLVNIQNAPFSSVLVKQSFQVPVWVQYFDDPQTKDCNNEELTHHWRVPPLAWRGLAKTQIQPWSQQPTHLSAEHRRSKDQPGRRHAAEGRHSKPGASSAASASSSPGRQSQQPPHPHLLHTLPENLGKRREIGFLCLVRTGSPKDENKQTSVKIKDERSLENRPEETAGLYFFLFFNSYAEAGGLWMTMVLKDRCGFKWTMTAAVDKQFNQGGDDTTS